MAIPCVNFACRQTHQKQNRSARKGKHCFLQAERRATKPWIQQLKRLSRQSNVTLFQLHVQKSLPCSMTSTANVSLARMRFEVVQDGPPQRELRAAVRVGVCCASFLKVVSSFETWVVGGVTCWAYKERMRTSPQSNDIRWTSCHR